MALDAMFNDGNIVVLPPSSQSEPQSAVKHSMLPRSLHQNPLFVTSAKGIALYLEDGRTILDATCGAAVACIGHGEPRVKEAVCEQMDKFSYAHTLTFSNHPGEQLGRYLLDTTEGAMSRAYFISSGSEAMEAALKLARQYFLELSPPQPQRTHFISRHGSYHGNTLGALSVSGHVARRALFEPLLMQDTSRVSACNAYRGMWPGESEDEYTTKLADRLDREFYRVGPEKVCALVLEPVVGAALGCVPAVSGYLSKVKAICAKHGALLIFDEIMCGMGRTGRMHAWQYENVAPDLQTIGKGLGGGFVPLAAVLINDKIVNALDRGSGAFSHGQTFQGHAVACAAALEVQKIIKEQDLLINVQIKGQLLQQQLVSRLAAHPHVGDIRGQGLFWGLEFVEHKGPKRPFAPEEAVAMGIHQLALKKENGILLYPGTGSADGTRGDHIIVAPPYNVSEEEIMTIVELTERVVVDFFKEKTQVTPVVS